MVRRCFSAEDIVLIYAGQLMADELPLRDYHVPPVRRRHPSPFHTRQRARSLARVTRSHTEAIRSHAQGCKTMIAIDKRKLIAGRPDADSAYWN